MDLLEIACGDLSVIIHLIPLSLDLWCCLHAVLLKSFKLVKSMLNDVERSAQRIQSATCQAVALPDITWLITGLAK
jgi:hypothetical protein